MSTSAISCTGLCKTFRRAVYPSVHLQDHLLHRWRHREQWSIDALTDVDLHVQRGEWVGLYGPNGSGKTTLLRIIAGLLPADRGSVDVRGRLSAFLGLGTGFHPDRSCTENVYLHGLLHGLPPRSIRSQMDRVLEFAGIASHRDLPVQCLSTGMQLRLAYAASAFVPAEIALLDESLAVGDATFQETCRTHLREMKRVGRTVLLVSHDHGELERVCDRIVYLEQGKLVGKAK